MNSVVVCGVVGESWIIGSFEFGGSFPLLSPELGHATKNPTSDHSRPFWTTTVLFFLFLLLKKEERERESKDDSRPWIVAPPKVKCQIYRKWRMMRTTVRVRYYIPYQFVQWHSWGRTPSSCIPFPKRDFSTLLIHLSFHFSNFISPQRNPTQPNPTIRIPQFPAAALSHGESAVVSGTCCGNMSKSNHRFAMKLKNFPSSGHPMSHFHNTFMSHSLTHWLLIL